jgi:hypothetical protein
MLWRYRGCESHEEWFNNYPSDAWQLFRGASSQSGSIQRRQRSTNEGVFGIGDPGMGDAQRHAVVHEFVHARPSELGDGLAGKYQAHHARLVEELPEVDQREAMIENTLSNRFTAREALSFFKDSVAQCEDDHRNNRGEASQQDQATTFSRVAASSTNKQVRVNGAKQAAKVTHESHEDELLRWYAEQAPKRKHQRTIALEDQTLVVALG